MKINDKKYDTELITAGVETVYKYGVAFSGKNVEVAVGQSLSMSHRYLLFTPVFVGTISAKFVYVREIATYTKIVNTI